MSFEIKAGEYGFTVESAERVEFRTGSKGIKVVLHVDIGSKYPAKCWENFVTDGASSWRLDLLLESLGYERQDGDGPEDIEGLTGRAYFDTVKVFSEKHQKEFANLKVREYLPNVPQLISKMKEQHAPQPVSKHKPSPPVLVRDDDVPF